MSCLRRGVLMFLTGRGFFKIVPPLTINRDALLEAVDVIGDAMDEVFGARGKSPASTSQN